MRANTLVTLTVGILAVQGTPVAADHHRMQIEQVIGGVHGDTAAQAIQLRMRSANQDDLSDAQLLVYDANGENPVLLIDFSSDVSIHGQGVRVLIATEAFIDHTTPNAVPDFTMTNPIPPSYLEAGSLVYTNDGGAPIWWRLSWGGDLYTGPTNGNDLNDDDGDFGHAFLGPLPSDGNRALQFQGLPQALSTTNIEDYALSSGGATFVNNAGDSFDVNEAEPVEVLPAGFTRVRGLPISGSLSDLFTDDDARVVTRPDVFRTTSTPPVQVEIAGTSPLEAPTTLRLVIESHASVNNISQRVLLFNYDTSTYESVNVRVLGTTDASIEIVVSNDPQRFVEDGSGAMKALFQCNAVAFSIAPTWQLRIDRSIWLVTP